MISVYLTNRTQTFSMIFYLSVVLPIPIWIDKSIFSYLRKQNKFPRVLLYVLVIWPIKYTVLANMSSQIYPFSCYETTKKLACELRIWNSNLIMLLFAGGFLYTNATAEKKAIIVSRVVTPSYPPASESCLKFWYYMNGINPGELHLQVELPYVDKRVWERKQAQGDIWWLAHVNVGRPTLHLTQPYKVSSLFLLFLQNSIKMVYVQTKLYNVEVMNIVRSKIW